MANYRGYRQVPHGSYNEWRAATIGNGYDVDYYPKGQPYQCWDYCALLYFQYGLSLITRPQGNGTAAMCWTVSRQANSKSPFISLTGKENIKRGDILVWDRNAYSSTGHIAFADEDYNGTNNLKCLGQNQGSYNVKVTEISLSNFLGIFRNTDWDNTPPPTPTPATEKKKSFPWPVAWAHWTNFKK